LVSWVAKRKPVSGTIFLTHGERENLAGLQSRLVRAGDAADRVVVTQLDQTYEPQPAAPGDLTAGSSPRQSPDAAAHVD
jgi:metallo-beta-lactamase family protein